jgi:tRNA (guanine-N7-)-methyltransferase
MGRRVLRRNDTGLDLSGNLADAEQLPDDWSPDDLFTSPGPLEIEVGSGKGLFLETVSAEHPERNFLGIEIASKYARFAAARLARRQCKNAVVMAGDAQLLFQRRLVAGSAQAVHVYFPDPWWKKRHRKRRVMNKSFLEHVVRVLQPAGELHFWTDVLEYYEATLELLTEISQLKGPFPVQPREAEHDMDYHTHFERRVRLNEEPVYRSRFVCTPS